MVGVEIMLYKNIKNPYFAYKLLCLPVFFQDRKALDFIKKTIDEHGQFIHFPGIEEREEWLKEQRVKIFHDVHYEAQFFLLNDNECLVIWLMQPDGMYWMDDDGFGMEDDLPIYFYGVVDKTGHFLDQFKLYQIDKTIYNHDYDYILPKYKY